MEAIVKTMTWDLWPDSATDIFKTFRSSAGEEVVLEKNVFLAENSKGVGRNVKTFNTRMETPNSLFISRLGCGTLIKLVAARTSPIADAPYSVNLLIFCGLALARVP